MTRKTILGELLRWHRQNPHHTNHFKLTQKELGELTGYDHTQISRIERNQQEPTQAYLQKFTEVLNLPEEDIEEIWKLGHQQRMLLDKLPTPVQTDWGAAPDISILYGRDVELAHLRQWLIVDNCRLIAVLGMGGIGKTMLATKAAKDQAGAFEYVVWRSLRNSPPLDVILMECIQFLSNGQDIDPPADIDKRITHLINYLAKKRCLIVLDNVEAVLKKGRAGHYRAGYENYGRLFKRIARSKHRSCLLLTSREKPREIGELAGSDLPTRAYELAGLETEAGQQMLEHKHIIGSPHDWQSLVARYSGNPLALSLVAEMIREVYDGQIADFLAEGHVMFDDIRDVIRDQFDRLSKLEQALMYWLALEREPVSREQLMANLAQPVTRPKFQVALRSLRRRSLIEPGFTLQNVIMEYITSRFVDQIYGEIKSGAISLLQSHALVKAQSKTHINESQRMLILRPLVERLEKEIGQTTVEEVLRDILEKLRQTVHPVPGYAAGNILDILICLESDLKAFDFSYLTVRQADLQGADLTEVNFACARFEGMSFTGVFGGVLSVALCSQNRVVAAGTSDGDVFVWGIDDGRPVLNIRAHIDWVRSVDFSPDGSLLASGSGDQTIRLWDTDTGQCIRTMYGHESAVRLIAFSPDGRWLASGSNDHTIRLWDVETGDCLLVLTAHKDRVRSVAFNTRGDILASGSSDATIRLWSAREGRNIETLNGHSDWVRSVAFNPKQNLLASGSDDRSVRFWDVSSGECIKVLGNHRGRVRVVTFDKQGKYLASAGDDAIIRLWNADDGSPVKTLRGHFKRIRTVAFSANGRELISGGDDRTVRIWDVKTGHCKHILQGYSNRAWSLAFSHSGRLLASGSSDETIRIWNVARGQCLRTLHGHTNRVRAVAFSPDDTLLASGSGDQTVRLWNVTIGQCIAVLYGHSNRVWTVAIGHTGRLLASGSADQTIRLWDMHSHACLHLLTGHEDRVKAVAFSPDDRLLVSGSGDKTVRLWDTASGKECLRLEKHTGRVRAIAISPDGKLLATGAADNIILVWDLSSGQCLETLSQHTSSIRSLAFSPNGKFLFSGSADQTVRRWEISSGQSVGVFRGHHSLVRAVACHPAGALIASSGDNGLIYVWHGETNKIVRTLRPDRPYERMNITGVQGLTDAQIATLKALGAIDYGEAPDLGPVV